MNKEKMNSLSKYAQSIRDRMSAPIPEKHTDRVEAYKLYLTRELEAVTSKIEALKLEGGK